MNVEGLPFERQSYVVAHKHDGSTHAEFMADTDYEKICARCGKVEKVHEHTQEQNEIFNLYLWARLGVPASSLCTACQLHFLRFKDAIHDCKDLITCSNYIERAITCRKQFLKTAQKSKQQASLEQCLSTRQKECLTVI